MVPSLARADWPDYTLVLDGTASVVPVGAAIRNWGPSDNVFIAIDKRNPGADENTLDLKWYLCSNNDVCDNPTLIYTEPNIGTPLKYRNVLHPSLAIRYPSGGPITLKILRREKIAVDCDQNGVTAAGGDILDQKAVDLAAYDWTTSGSFAADTPVELNFPSRCVDTGFSEVKFLTPTAYACYTLGSDPGSAIPGPNDNIKCTNDGWPGFATNDWFYDSNMSKGSDSEDHPSFDFYDSTSKRAVAGHLYRAASADRVRVHFPDAAAPPGEPIIFYNSSGGDVAEHPSVVAANGKLHMVWNDNVGNSNLRYSVCDHTSTVDCTLQADWLTTPTYVRNSALTTYSNPKFAQLAIDGKKQFVVFQYDANPALTQIRVAVAERCEGDANWTIQDVRTPDFASEDQMIVYGDPVMVLNQDERIAHVLLMETNNYTNGYDLFTVTDSDLFWYRKGYSACL